MKAQIQWWHLIILCSGEEHNTKQRNDPKIKICRYSKLYSSENLFLFGSCFFEKPILRSLISGSFNKIKLDNQPSTVLTFRNNFIINENCRSRWLSVNWSSKINFEVLATLIRRWSFVFHTNCFKPGSVLHFSQEFV